VQRALDACGWTFLFAPAFHASTRHAVGPRKELGVRTAFNLLGPLTNPAFPEAQVVGVPRPELTVFMARCLARLGVRRAWVVHGSGLDELSLCAPTQVTEFAEDAAPRTFTIAPQDAGLAPCDPGALAGGDAAFSARAATELLDGAPGPLAEVVALNAAAALLVAGRVSDLASGVEEARGALRGGHTKSLLQRVKETTTP
jgi:anthranilate phosphoribosyltransferase